MNIYEINKELKLLHLTNKLSTTLNYYLYNTPQVNLSKFYERLDFLKQKYPHNDDIQFCESIQIYVNEFNKKNKFPILNIINNYHNEEVIFEIIKFLDTTRKLNTYNIIESEYISRY